MRPLLSCLLASLVLAGTLSARDEPGPTFLLLGSYHMANNPGHLVQSHHDDHGSPRRQREIAEVVACLKAFRPTRIAVEKPMDSPTLKADFEAYLADHHELAVNEVEQIGFRLAKASGITDLRGFDTPMPMKGAEEAMDFMEKQGPPSLNEAFKGDLRSSTEFQSKLEGLSVRSSLRALNEPGFQHANQANFMHMLQAGTDKDPLGVSPLVAWHERNLRMVASLLRAAKPGDRVLVIVGASHVKILRDLLGDTPEVHLDDPLAYL